MKKKHGPVEGELVVCKILKIYPNSAFAELVEYGRNGMIHVSEVASRWVRDIREFVKENQYVVCRVIGVDRDYLSLSMKRVRHEDASSRLNEFKRENKVEKLLEMASSAMKKSQEQMYEEVGFRLQEEFGSLSKAFEIAWKNPDLLRAKGIPDEWMEPILDVVRKMYSEKTFEQKAELSLVCYRPDGVEVIRKALLGAAKEGVEVKYISAPRYLIAAKGKNFKEIKAKVEKAAGSVVNEVNKSGGECSFRVVE